MKLNIYLISHPIIKKLSSEIIHPTTNSNYINTYIQSQLNLYLIYEIISKDIQTQNIYIKTLGKTKQICIFDPKESYLLLTNMQNCSNIIANIQLIIPEVHFVHTHFHNITTEYIDNNYLDGIIKKNKRLLLWRNC